MLIGEVPLASPGLEARRNAQAGSSGSGQLSRSGRPAASLDRGIGRSSVSGRAVPGYCGCGLLNRRCAASRPSASSVSTASAARATSASAILVRLEVVEDVVGERAPVAALGPADADAQAQELGRAEVLRDGAQAVVTGEPAAATGLEPPGLEIALVVDDEDRVRLELVERGGGLHRAAGLVHVRLGLQQADAVLVDADVGEPARELAAPRAAVPPGELVDDHEADVVAVARVLAARDCRGRRRAGRATRRVRPGATAGARISPRRSLRRRRSPDSAAASASAAGSSPSRRLPRPRRASSSGSSTRVGWVTLARTVSSGSSRNVTPAGTSISRQAEGVADPQLGDVDLDVLRAPRAAAPRR